jgi:hypothetical protein
MNQFLAGVVFTLFATGLAIGLSANPPWAKVGTTVEIHECHHDGAKLKPTRATRG